MKVPGPLLRDIATGKCMPFVGAGFSLNCDLPPGSQMPDWTTLGRILADEGNMDGKLTSPEIASLYERRFGRVQLIEALRRALHIDEARPGDAHIAFASLPFDTVYTTNFDLLLESAYQQIGRPFRSLVGELQIPFHGGIYTANIVKMHGDLRHEEHMIVTSDDFDHYLEKYPVIATHLSAMLITRTGLYIGYSHSDPDFLQIRKVLRSRLGEFERMGYIIQFDSSGEEEEQMLQSRLHVINLRSDGAKGRREVLVDFLRELQSCVDTFEATRLRERVPEAFERLERTVLEKSLKETDSSSLLTISSNACVVLIPFGRKYEFVYSDLIRPAAEMFGLEVVRPAEILVGGASIEQIKVAIHQCRLCIADISEGNPNVLYEVGIALALRKPTVLLSQEGTRLPSDFAGERILAYNFGQTFQEARKNLEDEIRRTLMTDSLAMAETLLKQNDQRGAVVRASIYLEQAMRELLRENGAKAGLLIGERTHHLTLTRMLEVLSDCGVISRDDVFRIRRSISVRNAVVHNLEEPNAAQAGMVVETIKDFAKRYLGAKPSN